MHTPGNMGLNNHRLVLICAAVSVCVCVWTAACQGHRPGTTDPPRCGDEVRDFGEVCDGAALGWETCRTFELGDGELACLPDCSGYDSSGCAPPCGNGTCDAWNQEDNVTCPTDCPDYTRVASGGHFRCMSSASGGVWCWGLPNGCVIPEELQDGYYQTPIRVNDLSDVVSLSASRGHICAATATGAAWCWGSNGHGQLGDPSVNCQEYPLLVPGIPTMSQITAGSEHTCARTTEGALWCWGRADHGQLGDGQVYFGCGPVPNNCPPAPVRVADITAAVDVSVGAAHSCAVTDAGLVWCWGMGMHGRLGTGSTQDASTPTQVVGLEGAIDVDAADYHSCAALADGTVWCWGSNAMGQLGDGLEEHTGCLYSSDCSEVPVQVLGVTDAVSVTTGIFWKYSCALLADGAVWCWGDGRLGHCGGGCGARATLPVLVENLPPATAITAGESLVCALVQDGEVWCWGGGALDGSGGSINCEHPYQVPTP